MAEWKHGPINGMTRKLKVSRNPALHNASCILYLVSLIALLLKTLPFVVLKKKKEELETERENLGPLREIQLKESEASGKISGLEKKIQYTEIEKVFPFPLL